MKKQLNTDDECPCFLWERGDQMDFTDRNVLAELSPSEVHVLPDGSVTNEPTFCFLVPAPAGGSYALMQISLKKLLPAISAAVKEAGCV